MGREGPQGARVLGSAPNHRALSTLLPPPPGPQRVHVGPHLPLARLPLPPPLPPTPLTLSRTKRILEACELTRGQGKTLPSCRGLERGAAVLAERCARAALGESQRVSGRGAAPPGEGGNWGRGVAGGVRAGPKEEARQPHGPSGQSLAEALLLFSPRKGALLPLGNWGSEGLSGGGEQRGWRPPRRKLNCT